MTGALRSLVRTPARIAAVAGVTFTQLVRMRLFLVPAVFGIGFLALQFLPYQGQLGVEFRGVQQLQLIKDIALGCMQLFGLIFCVGATAGVCFGLIPGVGRSHFHLRRRDHGKGRYIEAAV